MNRLIRPHFRASLSLLCLIGILSSCTTFLREDQAESLHAYEKPLYVLQKDITQDDYTLHKNERIRILIKTGDEYIKVYGYPVVLKTPEEPPEPIKAKSKKKRKHRRKKAEKDEQEKLRALLNDKAYNEKVFLKSRRILLLYLFNEDFQGKVYNKKTFEEKFYSIIKPYKETEE